MAAATLWGIACAATLAVGLSEDSWWRLPLFLGGSASLFTIWRMVRWTDKWSKYMSFGATVLVAGAVNRLLYIGDTLLSGTRYAEQPFFSSFPEQAIFKGELVTMLGTVITVATWLAAGGEKYSPGLVLTAPVVLMKRMLVIIYGFSLLGLTASQRLPAAAETLGQLLPTLLGLGIAAAFLLPLVTRRSQLSTVIVAVLMCSPFMHFALGTGMKENIILAMMPIAFTFWSVLRNPVLRTGLVGAALVTLGLLTAYVTQYRQDVWHSDRGVTINTAVSQFAAATDARGVLATSQEGITEFLLRSNASVYRGWTMSLADEYGFEPGLVFAPLAYVLVPRALWQAKPVIRQGWEYSGLVFGQAFISSSDSSTSAGLYPAFYLGFGWTAVIAGAVCLGLLMAGLLRLAWRIGGGLLVGLFAMSMVPYALRLDETWTVGALAGPAIGFIYLVAIFFASKMVSQMLPGTLPRLAPRAPDRVGLGRPAIP